MEDTDKQPAKTVRELSIEFAGFRDLTEEKFNNVIKAINDLTDQLRIQNANKADQKDLDNLKEITEAYHQEHKDYITRNEVHVGYIIIGIVMTVLGIIIKVRW